MQILTGDLIQLRQLQESDAEALVCAAADGELWSLPFTVVPSRETVTDYIARALAGHRAGTVLPFVVLIRATGVVVGSTRFWKIDRENRRLEIGGTWLAAAWQRTLVNTEAKYLILRHAFEDRNCVRVQLTTDILNERSRVAILRLGAVEEGIIRNERIMPDGRKRTSIRFSIIDEEWPRETDPCSEAQREGPPLRPRRPAQPILTRPLFGGIQESGFGREGWRHRCDDGLSPGKSFCRNVDAAGS